MEGLTQAPLARLGAAFLICLSAVSAMAAETTGSDRMWSAVYAPRPADTAFLVLGPELTPDDTSLANMLRDRLRREGFSVLPEESEKGEAGLLVLTFEMKCSLPTPKRDRLGVDVEVHGASGEGISTGFNFDMDWETQLYGAPPPPVAKPVIRVEMRLTEGGKRLLWTGRAEGPLGRSCARDTAGRLLRALLDDMLARTGE